MVLSKCALYVASVLIASAAYGQSASPLVVIAPNYPSVDGSCVRLYEQRTNGSNFVSFCAPNAITTNNAITLPNLTAGGVLMAAPTAAAPAGSFYSTNNFSEIYKICHPGTTFGTCWSMQTATSGTTLQILNNSGGVFATLDSGPGSLTSVFVTGTSGLTGGSLSIGGASHLQDTSPSLDNAYDLGTPTFDWRTIRFQTSIEQNGTTRIDSSGNYFGGNVQGSQVIGTTGFYVGATQIVENTGPYWTGPTMTPLTTNSADLGLTTKQWRHFRMTGDMTITSATGSGSILSTDGGVTRVQITNPGSGSDAGAGITQLNAAGGIVFKTFYNGNIQTAYTGGATVVACFNSSGVLVRGVSTTSC